MKNDDIICMAREAGFLPEANPVMTELLVRFAALVEKRAVSNIDPASWMSYQEGYAAGAAAEREASRKISP